MNPIRASTSVRITTRAIAVLLGSFNLVAHAGGENPPQTISPRAQAFLEADSAPLPVLSASSTVEDYVRIALLRNPGLQAAYYRWSGAVDEVPQQATLPDPRVSYTYFIESIETRVGPQQNIFMVSQTLPWLGKLNAAGNVARRESERMWWMLQRLRLEIIRDVKTAYYDYAYLGESIRINSDVYTLLKGLDPVAQQQVRGGGTYADLLQLQVEVGLMQDKVATLESRRPALSARLRALLNLPGDELLPFPRLLPPNTAALNTRMLKERLAYNNPELNALRSAIEREAQQERVARLAPIPDPMVSFNYFDIGKRTDAGAPPDNGQDAMSVTVSFNVPLWFGKYQAEARQAEANSLAAAREYNNQANLVDARLEQLLAQIRNSQRRIALYRDSLVPIAQEALTNMDTSYRGGRNSVTDVLSVEQRMLFIQDDYWRSIAELGRQAADLEAISGGSLAGDQRPPAPPANAESAKHLIGPVPPSKETPYDK